MKKKTVSVYDAKRNVAWPTLKACCNCGAKRITHRAEGLWAEFACGTTINVFGRVDEKCQADASHGDGI